MELNKLELLFEETKTKDCHLTVDQFVEVCKINNIIISEMEIKKMNKYISYIYFNGYGTLYGRSKSKIFDTTKKYIDMLESKIYDKLICIEVNKSLDYYELKYKRLSPIDRIIYEKELQENCIFTLDCVYEYIEEREFEKINNYELNYK